MSVVVLVLVLAVVAIAVVGLVIGVRRRGGPEASASPGAAPPAPPEAESEAPPEVPAEAPPEPAVGETAAPPEVPPEAPVRPRLRDRLGRTRAALSGYVRDLRGRTRVDDTTWEELEEALVVADVGVETAGEVLEAVRARTVETRTGTFDDVMVFLQAELVARFAGRDRGLHRREGGPSVWMLVGVNGVGKTTTIAKLAETERGEGRGVLMAAADTFRAAAADQLALWAERTGSDLVRGAEGADPASVVFDAMDAASSRNVDLVLVDTAGRLHTKVNLMEELKKLRRVVERTPEALCEVLLVLDATTGQNGLAQAQVFTEAVDVTGVVLTKLDGTAKGGIVLAIEQQLGVPVKLVGVGEGAGDLVPFDPEEFVAALLTTGDDS